MKDLIKLTNLGYQSEEYKILKKFFDLLAEAEKAEKEHLREYPNEDMDFGSLDDERAYNALRLFRSVKEETDL